jgi:hypothetical protein
MLIEAPGRAATTPGRRPTCARPTRCGGRAARGRSDSPRPAASTEPVREARTPRRLRAGIAHDPRSDGRGGTDVAGGCVSGRPVQGAREVADAAPIADRAMDAAGVKSATAVGDADVVPHPHDGARRGSVHRDERGHMPGDGCGSGRGRGRGGRRRAHAVSLPPHGGAQRPAASHRLSNTPERTKPVFLRHLADMIRQCYASRTYCSTISCGRANPPLRRIRFPNVSLLEVPAENDGARTSLEGQKLGHVHRGRT